MQTVVLAAGLGTRLKPITGQRSKAMVPVLGRPLVERALLPLVANRLRKVLFVIGPDDDEIQRHFFEKTDLDLETRFVVQEKRLGMAHALGLAAPFLDGDFVVSSCDSLVSTDHVRQLLVAHKTADAVLSLLNVSSDLVSRSAAVVLDGNRVCQIVEKPKPEEAPSNTVSLPLYILPHSFLKFLPRLTPSTRGELELQDALQELIDRGDNVVGVRADSRVQVSTPDDLLLLNQSLLQSRNEDRCVEYDSIGSGTVLRDPLRIERGVTIGQNSEIGPNVYLESGCSIGDRVVIRDSVVLRGVKVPNNEVVEGVVLA